MCIGVSGRFSERKQNRQAHRGRREKRIVFKERQTLLLSYFTIPSFHSSSHLLSEHSYWNYCSYSEVKEAPPKSPAFFWNAIGIDYNAIGSED